MIRNHHVKAVRKRDNPKLASAAESPREQKNILFQAILLVDLSQGPPFPNLECHWHRSGRDSLSASKSMPFFCSHVLAAVKNSSASTKKPMTVLTGFDWLHPAWPRRRACPRSKTVTFICPDLSMTPETKPIWAIYGRLEHCGLQHCWRLCHHIAPQLSAKKNDVSNSKVTLSKEAISNLFSLSSMKGPDWLGVFHDGRL